MIVKIVDRTVDGSLPTRIMEGEMVSYDPNKWSADEGMVIYFFNRNHREEFISRSALIQKPSVVYIMEQGKTVDKFYVGALVKDSVNIELVGELNEEKGITKNSKE